MLRLSTMQHSAAAPFHGSSSGLYPPPSLHSALAPTQGHPSSSVGAPPLLANTTAAPRDTLDDDGRQAMSSEQQQEEVHEQVSQPVDPEQREDQNQVDDTAATSPIPAAADKNSDSTVDDMAQPKETTTEVSEDLATNVKPTTADNNPNMQGAKANVGESGVSGGVTMDQTAADESGTLSQLLPIDNGLSRHQTPSVVTDSQQPNASTVPAGEGVTPCLDVTTKLSQETHVVTAKTGDGKRPNALESSVDNDTNDDACGRRLDFFARAYKSVGTTKRDHEEANRGQEEDEDKPAKKRGKKQLTDPSEAKERRTRLNDNANDSPDFTYVSTLPPNSLDSQQPGRALDDLDWNEEPTQSGFALSWKKDDARKSTFGGTARSRIQGHATAVTASLAKSRDVNAQRKSAGGELTAKASGPDQNQHDSRQVKASNGDAKATDTPFRSLDESNKNPVSSPPDVDIPEYVPSLRLTKAANVFAESEFTLDASSNAKQRKKKTKATPLVFSIDDDSTEKVAKQSNDSKHASTKHAKLPVKAKASTRAKPDTTVTTKLDRELQKQAKKKKTK